MLGRNPDVSQLASLFQPVFLAFTAARNSLPLAVGPVVASYVVGRWQRASAALLYVHAGVLGGAAVSRIKNRYTLQRRRYPVDREPVPPRTRHCRSLCLMLDTWMDGSRALRAGRKSEHLSLDGHSPVGKSC